MIFKQFSSKKKKRINVTLFAVGILGVVLGFIPGFLPYQWGLVIFVFSLVAAGIVKVVLPEAENNSEPKLPNSDLSQPPV